MLLKLFEIIKTNSRGKEKKSAQLGIFNVLQNIRSLRKPIL